MVLKILIVMSSLSFFAKISSSVSMHVNYVKPFGSERASKSPCSDVKRPCLTLNEYASNSDEYFVNNTRFYFYPGIHRLEYSINLVNLHNVSFLGRPGKSIGWPNGDQVVTMAVDSSVSITWNESWNIEISSIGFFLHDNFTFILRFEHSQLVQLANISIYGNGYSGCSSIISEESVLEFNNSVFIGINGFLGACSAHVRWPWRSRVTPVAITYHSSILSSYRRHVTAVRNADIRTVQSPYHRHSSP